MKIRKRWKGLKRQKRFKGLKGRKGLKGCKKLKTQMTGEQRYKILAQTCIIIIKFRHLNRESDTGKS
jgi:hypothetical protein